MSSACIRFLYYNTEKWLYRTKTTMVTEEIHRSPFYFGREKKEIFS